LAHIRFRKAWLVQGYTLDEIPFRAAGGVWGSWLGLVLNIFCLIAQFYIALFPIGGEPNANSFFQAYLAAPIVLAFFIVWKLWHKTRFVRPHEVDLISGRRDMNLVELRAEDREARTHWGPWKKYVNLITTLTSRFYFWMC
jgi:amino acid transporter